MGVLFKDTHLHNLFRQRRGFSNLYLITLFLHHQPESIAMYIHNLDLLIIF